jgi:hypothetical protein
LLNFTSALSAPPIIAWHPTSLMTYIDLHSPIELP